MGELHADLPLAAFAHIRDSFGSRTGAAQTCLKALRAAYTWGKEQGYKGGEAVFDVRNTIVRRVGLHHGPPMMNRSFWTHTGPEPWPVAGSCWRKTPPAGSATCIVLAR